ncbi:MAG: ABC transporter ATP-binding protein [Candidatus Magasanikbacteria bacterium CG10_big_fil_rev_8_21_14_0_10_47_10]|uniref:ABC transporter ATP-binding protein n=1 Tax=Candidatus Magasanikbacteria bacterium CG10_big_fil_rev_8_21_14_0_10_47_10 TaxID=1974652 RepID=A0A2H0TQH3_9BACT|nr:MAG: ABC transporter ATP-binding protein [Candidatus Magasanikbacteria bacterium CG10_big_fil_rev_8_21_14_0_10_47_10]
MKRHTKRTLQIYWESLKGKRVLSFFVILGIVASSIFNLAPPLLYKEFFNTLLAPRDAQTTHALVQIIGFVFIVHFIGWFFWRLTSFIKARIQIRVLGRLFDRVFNSIHHHSVGFFNNTFVGSLVKRVNRFVFAFNELTDTFLYDLLGTGVEIVIITTVLFFQSPVLGWIILGWSVVFIFFNYLFTVYKLKFDIEQSALDSRTTGHIADTVTNQINLKFFASLQSEATLFKKIHGEQLAKRLFRWNLEYTYEAFQTLLMIMLEFAMFYYAIRLWQEGQIQVGDFVLIQAYLITLFNRLWGFARVIRRIYEQLADAEEMTEILETPREIKDLKRAKDLMVKKGAVVFRNVNFFYNKTRPVLKNFSLSLKPGERVALVGPSGAGKSTIIKLLLRFSDIAQGSIIIDKQDIRKVTQDSLHRAMSVVPQDPILFHRSLMDNIRYGKPGATDDEVIEASKAAHCHEFIDELPEQYGTYVGERGVKLSGGERQRVAIARAILKNAPILVLDEATSSLDSESEFYIQEALDVLMKEKTVIVIAHRLSTIMRMDRIILLENGMIAEQGTHTQLLSQHKGRYRRLWELQAGGFIT